MSSKFPSLLKCFLFTLKQCTTNLACAPFCFAIFFYSFYYCWPYMEQLPDHLNVVAVDQDNSALSRRLTQAMRASPQPSGHSANNQPARSRKPDAQRRDQRNLNYSSGF